MVELRESRNLHDRAEVPLEATCLVARHLRARSGSRWYGLFTCLTRPATQRAGLMTVRRALGRIKAWFFTWALETCKNYRYSITSRFKMVQVH